MKAAQTTSGRWGALLVLLAFCLLFTASAHAVRLTTPHFIFETDEAGQVVAEGLRKRAEYVLANVSRTLGIDHRDQPTIHVTILRGSETFRDAIGGDHPPAEWTAGLAMPAQRRIYLKVDASTFGSLNDIFLHEVSHVVLHRAAGGHRLPLWFIEGVAVNQAQERLKSRWMKTAESMLGDGPMPLSALKHRFPRDTPQVDRAYAQSSAFVRYLLQRFGWPLLRYVIAHVRHGHDFEEVLEESTGNSLSQLEEQWRLELDRQASWIPFLTGEGLMWVLISFLFVLTYFVHRRRKRAQLAAMDSLQVDEEDDEEFA